MHSMKLGVMEYMVRVSVRKCAVCFMIPLFTIGLFPSCENLDIKKEVLLKTGEVLVSAQHSAIVSGTVFDVGENGLLQYGHCWSESNNPTIENDSRTSLGEKSSAGIYNSLITDLSPNSRYYVRAYASNNSSTKYGEEIEFITPSQNPDIYMPTTSEAVAGYANNTVVIDGSGSDPEWDLADLTVCRGRSLAMPVDMFTPEDLSCVYKVLFNEEGIMFWIEVRDETIITYDDVRHDGVYTWMADFAEIYLHNGDYPTADGEYTLDNSFQIRFNPYYSSGSLPPDLDEVQSGRNGRDWKPLEEMYAFIDFIAVPSDKGYNVEALVKWDIFATKPENLVYFEIQAGDADNPDVLRESIIAWNNTDDAIRADEAAWKNINFLGRLLLYNPNP
jgi:hypothetical protein